MKHAKQHHVWPAQPPVALRSVIAGRDASRPADVIEGRRAASPRALQASARRYTRAFFLALLGFAAALMGFNAAVDPYDLLGVRVPGVNEVKPATYDSMRLHKALSVERMRPNALILGSSRAHFGLDPAYPGWTEKPVFNLSLFDGRVYEMLRYLQHAQAIHPVRQVVLALDFLSFNARHRTIGDFDEKRLADGGLPETIRRVPDLVAGLASLDALRTSVDTLRAQDDPCIARERPDGTHSTAHLECEVRSIGHRQMFLDNEAEFLSRQYDVYRFDYAEGGETTFDMLRRIVQFAREHDIDLRLLISPPHARQLETIALAGLWPAWEQWKREIVAVLSEDAAAHRDRQPFPLWDFSGYNSVTTEPVPELGDVGTEMAGYWDSSHYKKEIGDLMLDRVLGAAEQRVAAPRDFGVLLTQENLEENLRHALDAQAAYRRSRPGELHEIAAFAGLNEAEFEPFRGVSQTARATTGTGGEAGAVQGW